MAVELGMSWDEVLAWRERYEAQCCAATFRPIGLWWLRARKGRG